MRSYVTHTEAELRDAAAFAVERAVAAGASARASANHSGSGKIVVQGGEVETAERHVEQSLQITVFHENRHGSASTAALDHLSIGRAVDEAVLIATRVEPEADGGLPPADWLATDGPSPELFAPGVLDAADLLDTAFLLDRAATAGPRPPATSLRISQAAAFSSEGIWALATSNGFCRSRRYSDHSLWCMALAQAAGDAASDYYSSRDRLIDALEPAEMIARRAVERTLMALGGRSVPSHRGAVLLEPRVATVLIDEIVGALSGMAQFRKASFLVDPIGRLVAAAHLDLVEDPFEPLGLASGGFDSEGVAGSKRSLIEAGVARGLLLSSYSARKLGMRSTGNALGPYNLRLSSRDAGGDRDVMLASLGTGLLVTEFQGGETDPISGNWTRAVKGYWVEGGTIVHPVLDVTLAGSLPDMLMAIRAVGDDVERHGAVRTGSILIDMMQVGGSA